MQESDISLKKVLNLLRMGNSIEHVADSINVERMELQVFLGHEVSKFSQRLIKEETIKDYFGFDNEDWETVEAFYRAGRAEAELRIRDVILNDALETKDAKKLLVLLK